MSEQLEADVIDNAEYSEEVETESVETEQIESEVETDVEDSETEESETEQEDDRPLDAKAQRLIAEKAFKAREAKREADELREKLLKYESQQPTQKEPELTIPDRWDFDTDEDYAKAINDYADRKASYATQAEQQRIAAQQKQYEQQQRLQQEQEALTKKAESYTTRAKTLGVKSEELSMAGNIVASYGIKDEIASAILEDDEGALITLYLAANPGAIEKLNNANFVSAGQIYSDIKQKASGLKGNRKSAPPPAKTLTGSASSKSVGVHGATFE